VRRERRSVISHSDVSELHKEIYGIDCRRRRGYHLLPKSSIEGPWAREENGRLPLGRVPSGGSSLLHQSAGRIVFSKWQKRSNLYRQTTKGIKRKERGKRGGDQLEDARAATELSPN